MKYFSSIQFLFFLVFISYSNIFAQSPYKSNWQKNTIMIGGSIGIAFLASAVHDNATSLTIDEINSLNREDVNSFDRSATYNYSLDLSATSDIIVASCLTSPLTLFLSDKVREDFSTVSIMYMETIILATFTPSFGKSLGRIRPYAYNEDAPLDKKMNNDIKSSFWSGHTSWAFSSAVFFATVYSDFYPKSKWKPFIWGGSLLAASAVGYLRYESGAHFPTDVFVGAIVGSSIGYLIPYIYRNRDESSLSISPSLNFNKLHITLNYSF